MPERDKICRKLGAVQRVWKMILGTRSSMERGKIWLLTVGLLLFCNFLL